MAQRKKRTASHRLNDATINEFERVIGEDWTVEVISKDYGIDLEVNIFEIEETTEKVFKVQMKATENVDPKKTAIKFKMDTGDLVHYENSAVPIVIIRAVTDKKRSFWKFYHCFAQKYINEELSKSDPGWRKQKTKTIPFPPESELKGRDPLAEIADQGRFYIAELLYKIKHPEAMPPWLDGIPSSDDERLKNMMAEALRLMAEEKNREAVDILEEAKKLYRVEPLKRMAILSNIGAAKYYLCDYNNAIADYIELLELSESAPEENSLIIKSSALSDLGKVCTDIGDLENAIKYQEQALQIQRQLGNKHEEAITLVNLGIALGHSGDLIAAEKCERCAIDIFDLIKHDMGKATALSNLSLIYLHIGDLDTALGLLNKALIIDRWIGSRYGEAVDLGNIGTIYLKMGKPYRARRCFIVALKINRKIGNLKGEAIQLGNLGLVCLRFKKWKEATEYQKMALKIFIEINNPDGQANAHGSMGYIAEVNGDWEKALCEFNIALEIARKYHFAKHKAIALANLGLVYEQIEKYDKALEYMEMAYDIFKTNHYYEWAKEAIIAIERVKAKTKKK